MLFTSGISAGVLGYFHDSLLSAVATIGLTGLPLFVAGGLLIGRSAALPAPSLESP